MSTDLDRGEDLVDLLQATLAQRAETVQRGRIWAGPAGVPVTPIGRRRWLAPLAAAVAAAAIVVGIVVAVEQLPHHKAPVAPSTHHPSGSPTSPAPTSASPSSSPTTSPTVTAALACPATLPSAWSAAYRNGLVNVGGAYAYPMSVAADGTLVVYRDDGVTPGSPRQILLVAPGRAPQMVYQLANPDVDDVQSAYLVGKELVVALGFHPRPPKDQVPGDTPMPNVTSLFAINLVTHQQKMIASTPHRRNSPVGLAVTYGHTVYWDVQRNYTATTGTVHSYDLNTGARHTVYTGPIGYPAASAAGIGWFEKHAGYQVHAPVSLPPAVSAAVPATERLTVGTDGTAFAWVQSPSVIGWWTPGAARPVYRRLPRRLQLPGSFPDVVVVSGSFVFPGNGDLLDMKTGALTSLGNGQFGSYERGDAAITSYGSTVIGTAQQPGNGGFVDGYWEDPATVVLRVDTSHLPELHC
jgi:hypothetical protein